MSGPSHGTLALNADGGFTYTPDANYNGPDTFVYRVRDGAGAIGRRNRDALGRIRSRTRRSRTSQAKTLNEDTLKAITLTGTDAEGSPLTFTIVTPPAHGVLTGTAAVC